MTTRAWTSDLLYLLDTNIVSNLVRRPQGPAAARVADVGENSVCTSIIVAAELSYGAAKLGSTRLSFQLEAVLAVLEVVPFDTPADRIYGALRAKLEVAGQLIGPHDMLIAAHALALGRIVVTNKEREFARVEGLTVTNWLP